MRKPEWRLTWDDVRTEEKFTFRANTSVNDTIDLTHALGDKVTLQAHGQEQLPAHACAEVSLRAERDPTVRTWKNVPGIHAFLYSQVSGIYR